MLNAADSYASLLEIDADAIAAGPLAQLACCLEVVHVGEVDDAEGRPGAFEAAARYDLGGKRCQSTVEPSGFASYGEP
jgi:hypothetical protein